MSPDTFRKFDLSGRTALVTGGATGIGYFISRALAKSGAKVMVAARREAVLKEGMERLLCDCPNAEFLYETVDLADRKSVHALASSATQRMGGVDIFVGNAGQDCLQLIGDIEDDTIDYMLQMNVAANISLVRRFLPHMRKQRWGRVLFSSSVTSIAASAHEGLGVYTAAKGGLNAFTRTAAVETGHDRITFNSIVIGFFLTDIVREAAAHLDQHQGKGAGKALLTSLSSMSALGRPCECEEIEGLVQLLASDAGSAMTGTNTVIDGGMSVMLRPRQPPDSN